MTEPHDRTEINRLYWHTDASVADIADEVGVSRRALYDAIEPRPAGADCPECGEPLGFRNRTALEQGEAECAACGFEAAASAADSMDRDWDASDKAARGPTRMVPLPRGGTFASAAFLAGIIVGAIATWAARRS